MSTFAIAPLGCKVNSYEAESIAESLKASGLTEVDFKETADVYCIFTCAVTNTAASKSRQKIHQAIRQNEKALICVVGCYVQTNAERIKQEERIDILVGSSHKQEIPALILNGLQQRIRQQRIDDVRQSAEFEALPIHSFAHRTRAYLKVQDGCNQFCSYCVIPYARGKERSLAPEKAVLLAKELAATHQEIVLAGIHTGRYGREHDCTLAELIRRILAETKIQRIRISSIEITEISDELLDLIQNEPRVARHLHIPLQSGCDTVLKRMRRPYTTAEFLKRIEDIRSVVPGISISTDLIVGFPQESEEEFETTCEFLYQARFSFLHVFPFSCKDKTLASEMPGQLPSALKKERARQCLKISQQLKREYESSRIGKTMQVLIEKSEKGESIGHTSEYIELHLEHPYPSGTMVGVTGYRIGEEMYGKELHDETVEDV